MLITPKEQSLTGCWGKCQIHATYSGKGMFKESNEVLRKRPKEREKVHN